MRPTSPLAKELAQKLIEQETHKDATSLPHIFEELRSALISLVGVAGFEALLSRSFALAKGEVAWLGRVPTQAEGTLGRLREAALVQSPEDLKRGCLELLTQFMGLLVTFIGEDLTVQIIQDSWSDLSSPPLNGNTKEKSA